MLALRPNFRAMYKTLREIGRSRCSPLVDLHGLDDRYLQEYHSRPVNQITCKSIILSCLCPHPQRRTFGPPCSHTRHARRRTTVQLAFNLGLVNGLVMTASGRYPRPLVAPLRHLKQAYIYFIAKVKLQSQEWLWHRLQAHKRDAAPFRIRDNHLPGAPESGAPWLQPKGLRSPYVNVRFRAGRQTSSGDLSYKLDKTRNDMNFRAGARAGLARKIPRAAERRRALGYRLVVTAGVEG